MLILNKIVRILIGSYFYKIQSVIEAPCYHVY